MRIGRFGLVVSVLLTACGDSGDDEAAGTETSEETTSTTEEATTTTEEPTTTTRRPATTTTTLPPPATHIWETSEGWQYGVAIGFGEENPAPSVGGCYESPPPGRTNVRFFVELRSGNTDRNAPIPQVSFGANLIEDGSTVDPSITGLDGAYDQVEVAPAPPGTHCFLAYSVFSEIGSNESLAPGEPRVYVGTVANVPEPPPAGLALVVRVFRRPGDFEEFTVPYTPIDLP